MFSRSLVFKLLKMMNDYNEINLKIGLLELFAKVVGIREKSMNVD